MTNDECGMSNIHTRDSSLVTRHSSLGNVMVIVMMLIALVGISVPILTQLIRQQAKMTVKSQRDSVAFQLAEAAVKRGYWKLKERSSNWTTITGGTIIAGYNNDTVYSDIAGGTYQIKMSGDSSLKQVTLVGTGKDTSGNEFRAIQAVYVRATVTGALQAAGYSVGAIVVHWGPVLSTGSMDISSNLVAYPRKRARGAITPRDTDPAAPNTDNLEWWSYNASPGVPDVPLPDLTYYRAQATAQSLYYTTNQTINALVDTDETKVRFFEANATFTGSTHLRGKLFVMGDLRFSGTANSAGQYTLSPPSTAYLEYRVETPAGSVGDTSAQHQYPGDAGLNLVTKIGDGVCNGYVFPTGCVAHNNRGSVRSLYVMLKGFAYVAGNLFSDSACRMHGAVMQPNGASLNNGDMEMFYDPTIDVQMSDASATLVSWKEIRPTSF